MAGRHQIGQRHPGDGFAIDLAGTVMDMQFRRVSPDSAPALQEKPSEKSRHLCVDSASPNPTMVRSRFRALAIFVAVGLVPHAAGAEIS